MQQQQQQQQQLSSQWPAASGQQPAHIFQYMCGPWERGVFFQSLRHCARCKQGSHCALTCMESELGAKSQYRCRPPCRQLGLSFRCAGPVSGLRPGPAGPQGHEGGEGQMAWELNGKGAIPRCALRPTTHFAHAAIRLKPARDKLRECPLSATGFWRVGAGRPPVLRDLGPASPRPGPCFCRLRKTLALKKWLIGRGGGRQHFVGKTPRVGVVCTPSVSGLSAFPRCRFPRLPWPVRSTCSFSCREDGSIFCLGSPRRPTSTSLARFPRRPEHGTARARLLARAPSSKSRRAFVGKTSDATLLSSRGG